QKVLEEAPSPALAPDEERALCDASVRLARAAGYENAGAVELLFDPASRAVSLMELHATLQLAHPVTAVVAGGHIGKLQNGAAPSGVVVRGGVTNKAFLLALLDRPEVASGSYDNHWLDELARTGEHVSRAHREVALLCAAVEVYHAELASEHAQFLGTAARGR